MLKLLGRSNKMLKQKIKKPEIRFLKEMKTIVYDQEWLKKNRNPETFPLYEMYRGLETKNGWRYDITVIPPKMLGEEFVKTKGNRNSDNFLEIYIVLKGKAMFLLQKMENGKTKDVYAVKAKTGDYVLDPVGYYIISINPSSETLELGNWVPEKNNNIYEDIEKNHGACYFYTDKGWIKNKNYKKVPKLKFKKPFKLMPKNLSFLSKA